MAKALSPRVVARMREARAAGMSVAAISKKFKRSEPTIYKYLSKVSRVDAPVPRNRRKVAAANKALKQQNFIESLDLSHLVKKFIADVKRAAPNVFSIDVDITNGEAVIVEERRMGLS